ncbi:MAG TPA: prolipoprotein diacylglyceryl transferase [Bellilinea sp.]
MPSSFNIGPLTIHLYGILIMIGALAAAFLAARLAKRRGIDADAVWDMFPWLIIGGIIGARLWHVLTPPASMVEQGITTGYYLTHPLEALSIWKGGLGIPGAVIGGAIALWIYSRKRKLSFGMWTDIIAPGLALAQAIGRIGNYLNQEVYGAPTNLPWAITIDRAHRLPEYIEQATYHPLFAYEAIYNLINMAFLLWIGKKFAGKLRTGDIFLTYLVIYPVGRFFLEFLRLDPSPVAGVNINQTIMAVIAVAAAAMLIFRRRKPEAAAVPAAEPADQ